MRAVFASGLSCIALAVVLLATELQAAPGGDEIVVAVVAATPSPLQPEGLDVVTGVRSAIAALRAKADPIAGRLRLISYEEDCTAQGGATIAAQIVVRGATLVIGHVCSASALAAARIYAERKILLISPGARTPRLTAPRAGPTIFRLASRDDRFGFDTARTIFQRFNGYRIAIVHDKSVQARGLADDLQRQLVAVGTKAAVREAYVNGEKEYNALVAKLAAQSVQVLVIPAQPIEAGVIFRALRAKGSSPILLGSEILAVPEIEALAKEGKEQILLMLPAMGVSVGETHQQGGAATSGTELSGTALRARAALEAWVAAANRTQSTDNLLIGRSLETETAETVLGSLRFDVKGDAMLPSFAAHQWLEGRWRPIDQ